MEAKKFIEFTKRAGAATAFALLLNGAARSADAQIPVPQTLDLDSSWTEDGVKIYWDSGANTWMSVDESGSVPLESALGEAEGISAPDSELPERVRPESDEVEDIQLDPNWTENGVQLTWEGPNGIVTSTMSVDTDGVTPLSSNILGEVISVEQAE